MLFFSDADECLKALTGLQTITIEPQSGLPNDADSAYQSIDAISSKYLTTITIDAYHPVLDPLVFSVLSRHLGALDDRLRQATPYRLCFLIYERRAIREAFMAEHVAVIQDGFSKLHLDGRLQIDYI